MESVSNLKKSLSFVLLYFRICARRANFSHLETLGSVFLAPRRQVRKSFFTLRLCGKCSDAFWLRLRRARLFVVISPFTN